MKALREELALDDEAEEMNVAIQQNLKEQRRQQQE